MLVKWCTALWTGGWQRLWRNEEIVSNWKIAVTLWESQLEKIWDTAHLWGGGGWYSRWQLPRSGGVYNWFTTLTTLQVYSSDYERVLCRQKSILILESNKVTNWSFTWHTEEGNSSCTVHYSVCAIHRPGGYQELAMLLSHWVISPCTGVAYHVSR
jgi:hypothetical protein